MISPLGITSRRGQSLSAEQILLYLRRDELQVKEHSKHPTLVWTEHLIRVGLLHSLSLPRNIKRVSPHFHQTERKLVSQLLRDNMPSPDSFPRPFGEPPPSHTIEFISEVFSCPSLCLHLQVSH